MNFREYLDERGVKIDPDGVIETSAKQVLDYIQECGDMPIDLCGCTVQDRLVIVDGNFDRLDAKFCDFNGGIEIKHCKFDVDLDFGHATAAKIFRLEDVEVGECLTLSWGIVKLDRHQIDMSKTIKAGSIEISDE
ncbi:MAG: hypothetical protein WCO10_03445 [bacterium]